MNLLLEWGADPDLKDNDGICARQLARFHPRMLASMDKKEVQHLAFEHCRLQSDLPQIEGQELYATVVLASTTSIQLFKHDLHELFFI